MNEAARVRRDAARYEPQAAIPSGGSNDPLAELARLVGQGEPYRPAFRPHPEALPHRDAGHDDHDVYGAEARDLDPQEAEPGYDEDDATFHHEASALDTASPRWTERSYGAHDRHRDATEPSAYADEVALADQSGLDYPASAAIPDLWARDDDGRFAPEIDGHAVDGEAAPPSAHRASSARRPLFVLAAVLILTGGGLAATFLVKGSGPTGPAVAGAARGAPTIMAATGPTKVKVEDPSATAPEDKDAALLNRNAQPATGPTRIVSSQEQPVDLSQLPKTSDLAEGARPLPPAAPSPFPEPKKVKTFLVHPDGRVMTADGLPVPPPSDPPTAAATTGAGSPPAAAAPPAGPAAAPAGAVAPQPSPTIATLMADPLDRTTPAPPPHPAPAPGARPRAPKPTDTAEGPGSGSGFGLQLAASPTEADAEAAFANLKKKYPAQLGGYSASIHKSETGDKPVYRVRVGGMDRSDAKSLCGKLQAAGGSCFVVHN